jgi:hypothetical protein
LRSQILDEMGAEHLTHARPAEAFDVGILVRLVGPDGTQFDVIVLAPRHERRARAIG